MGITGEPVLARKNTITSLQLKQLLVDIKEHAPNVCIRYRLEGELWQKYFVRVMVVNDHRVLLLDERKDKLIPVPLAPIIQLELDNGFRQFQPFNHYDIVLDSI